METNKMGQKEPQQTKVNLRGMRIRAARSKIILFLLKNNSFGAAGETAQVKVANNNIYLEQSIQQQQQQQQTNNNNNNNNANNNNNQTQNSNKEKKRPRSL